VASTGAELLRILARAIVSRPEEVVVTEERRAAHVVLSLRVAPEDVGRVIGRDGRIIKAIRKVLRSTAGREARYTVVDVVSK